MYKVDVAEKGVEDWLDCYAGILTFRFNDLEKTLSFVREMIEQGKAVVINSEDEE